MDFVTLISLILSFVALILAFVLDGGVLHALLEPTAALIVFGGTFGAIGISFASSDLVKVPKLLMLAFRKKKQSRAELLTYFDSISSMVRKEGLLSLEGKMNEDKNMDPFLVSGLQMVVDGIDIDEVKETLENRIMNMQQRHAKGIGIFEAAGGYAPTMGVLGTVMGLVHVLSDLSNPDELGGKIAIAFIATMYGVGSANLIWLPIASKLKELDADETITKYMMLDGITMIQRGSNPRLIAERLEGYLDYENAKEARGE
ncbi:MAG TPA: flagellar motor protein [Lachnospiraceae bacterium]|nr:flagellar motor protein [Lachnospiraceae bacterium]